MKTKSDIAVEKLLANYSCAQSVLYSFCDDLHFDKDTALRMACGFGSGMARKQEVCGAISGGILTIKACSRPASVGRQQKSEKQA